MTFLDNIDEYRQSMGMGVGEVFQILIPNFTLY